MMLNLRNIYSLFLSLAGISLVALGIIQIPSYTPLLNFFLLLILAILTQSTMTYMVGGMASVSVSSAISLAAVPLYGPLAGVMVAAAAEISLWIISIRIDRPGWKRAAERLGVNVGMNGTAIFLAGLVFWWTANWLGIDTVEGQTVPWLLAAIVGDQVNLWLLVVIIYLAHGVKPVDTWLENRWASPMNILVMGVGGGLLALAVRQFGLLGIAIFFLPIVLSAYSFRVTVNNAKEQMVKLEEMVALRTQALADANQKMEGLNKEKDAFLAVLTHDMRTPLTSIKGYASILRDRELSREQQVKISKIILQSQDTLLEIVNNILEIEKLQSGTPILLEHSRFDLALLAKTTSESLQAQALEKDINLHCEQVPSPIVVKADMKKVQRVLLNLISNAIKYTPEGGAVSIDTQVNGRYAVVDVIDTGYGIPADELPHIFDRYSRVKKHQSIALGTGLGLAIVKSLVEAHEGQISVTSEEGVGSTFTVQLPV
jgi:signal transduction histidine kinase